MPGASAIKGYTADEIVGRHFSRFYTEEDRAAGEPQRALATALGKANTRRRPGGVRKDGTRFLGERPHRPDLRRDGQADRLRQGHARHQRPEEGRGGAGGSADRAFPGAEAAGARRADRRHRPRFQQSDHCHPRLGGDADARGSLGGKARPLSRGDHRDRRPRRRADQPSARFRPAPGVEAAGDRSQRAARCPCRRARPHARQPDRGDARSQPVALAGRGRSGAAGIGTCSTRRSTRAMPCRKAAG